MEHFGTLISSCAFLVLAVLAGVVTALNLERHALVRTTSLTVGAATFLGVLACCVVLAGLGLPMTIAQGIALALGTAASWIESV